MLFRSYGGETVRLSEIEALIAQTAKTRYDILVTAVYWRINDHVAVGIPQKGVAPLGASLPAQAAAAAAAPAVRRPPVAPAVSPVAPVRPAAPVAAAPLRAPVDATAPAPLAPVSLPVAAAAPAPAAAQRPAPRFEPIEADEVAAFKRALANAAGIAAVAVPAAAAKPGIPVRSGPLLPPTAPTGFEDTEMPGADTAAPDLGSTQYGELN